MKKTVLKVIIPVIAIAAVALYYSTAQAVNYHSGSGLVCSDCHTMHNTDGDGTDYNGGTPQDKLLQSTSTNALCLSCHDGQTGADAAPDVMSVAGAGQPTNRAAGRFAAANGTASISAHNLGVAAAVTAPGGTWATNATTGFTCADCHDPHGTANFRNLKLRPGGVGADVNVTDVTNPTTTPTATQYSVGDITYGADANENPDMSNWCSACHTAFNLNTTDQAAATWVGGVGDLGGDEAGDSGGSNAWHRHPTSHVTMAEGETNGHTRTVASYAALSSKTPEAGTNVPFCGSCHKAHGSDGQDKTTLDVNVFPNNLIYDDSSTATIQDGTSMAQTCNACHNK